MRLLALLGLALSLGGASGGTAGEIAFVALPTQGGANVMAIRADGSGARVVAAGAVDSHWSPGGSQIAYTGQRVDQNDAQTTLGIFVAPADGGPPTQITSGYDRSFGWSPDGRLIGFTRQERGHANLYVVRPDGSGLREVLDAVGSASWAGANRFLISPRQGLALVDLRGRMRILPHTSCNGGGAVSPNGRRLAFARCAGRPSRTGIAVERLDGSGLRRLARPTAAVSGDDPVWSPSGTRLAYVADRPEGYLEHTEIRMVSLAGAPLGNLDSHVQDHDEHPGWSPDGRSIVFDRDAAVEPIGEAVRLFVGDARTGRVRELYADIDRGSQTWRPHPAG